MGNVSNAENNARGARGKQKKGNSQSDSSKRRNTGYQSSDLENQQERADRANRQKSDVDSNGGTPTIGKILERLEFLEQAFNSYVGSHGQRLEARLSENKQFVERFSQEMELLRQDIKNLTPKLSEQELIEETQ